MEQQLLITDVNACYKNVDNNTVSAILEIKREDIQEYEMIFKYTFSINELQKNAIEVYKDLKIHELYSLYILLKDNPNYKGIFDIYFRVYQNELANLRHFAIEKMYEVNKLKEIHKESIFDKIKGGTKTFFQELYEEGSTNKKNGTIIKVAAYKKECPTAQIGEYANRSVIDVIRYGTDMWENIYSHEYGKYKTGGELVDVDSVSIYKVLGEEQLFQMIPLLDSYEGYDVIYEYLKMTPKEPHGKIIEEPEDIFEPRNIKFL